MHHPAYLAFLWRTTDVIGSSSHLKVTFLHTESHLRNDATNLHRQRAQVFFVYRQICRTKQATNDTTNPSGAIAPPAFQAIA